jgi:hypothetical protein
MKISDSGAPIQSGRGLQQVKEHVEKEFAKARTIERRRFGRPAPTDPALYGRRKGDAPQPVDAVLERFKQMIADAADPGVELVVEPEPLAQQAAPLLSSIGAVPVFRKKDVKCHEINEVFEGDIQTLFAAAESALFPDANVLKLNKTSSVWTRPIRLGKKA